MTEEKTKKYVITLEIPTVEEILENLRKSFPVVKFEVEEKPRESQTPLA